LERLEPKCRKNVAQFAELRATAFQVLEKLGVSVV
jgi:hypothetical protein